MCANIDAGINDSAGPNVFKINGFVYNRIGSLMPAADESPKFAQLYIYDTEHEIRNRISSIVSKDSDDTSLDPDIVNGLILMLDNCNPLVREFRKDFHLGIPYRRTDLLQAGAWKNVTMQTYACYNCHYRRDQPNPYLCCGRLFFQSAVDIFACVEECRLTWIADHQDDFRCEHFQGIIDAVSRGYVDGSSIGKQRVDIAICRVYGSPYFFTTFTCNPKWLEIKETMELECGQRPSDRPDVGCRVYHMNLSELMDDIKFGSVFGPIVAVLESVEFQKRGLPHAHILAWLQDIAAADIISVIDNYISTEILDPEEDPLGYALVEEFVMHGPFGDDNKNCPCMKNGSCSKHFPKQFQIETTTHGRGFIMYKRCDTGRYIIKNGVRLDNRYVVPYIMLLLKRYQAHINVEFCNQSSIAKYLCRYVMKGPDQANVTFRRTEKRKASSSNTFLCRYICDKEAYWCIFGFELHHKIPAIERLAVHLPSMNMVPYATGANLASLIATPFLQNTTLTEWFVANRKYHVAREISYCDFPTRWTWDSSSRLWKPRGSGTYKIGRMDNVHPSPGENYYLSMLLLVARGAQCYEDVRTVNGSLYGTCWQPMADDIEYVLQKRMDCSSYFVPDSQLRGMVIDELPELFSKNGVSITKYNLPSSAPNSGFGNCLIDDEEAYDIATLVDQAPLLYSRLNDCQQTAYDSIVRSVIGFGGTSKTFLWNSIITYVRSLGKIILAVASSGVASLLLPCSRTAHSRFKIPIDIDETTISNIKRGTILADLMKKHKVVFSSFGSLVARHYLLLVIEGGVRSKIVDATITNSPLWRFVIILELTMNMRLFADGLDSVAKEELSKFSDWILSVGDGTLPTVSHAPGDDGAWIQIPDDMLVVTTTGDRIRAMIDAVYDEFSFNFKDESYLCKRAIVSPTNDVADEINSAMISMVPGERKEYLSFDCVSKCLDTVGNVGLLYPIEFLNSLKVNNFPDHCLVLRVGVPVMHLRNLNQMTGLCNGTWLVITNLAERILEACIITGSSIGDIVYVPRIVLTATK
ncbi:hypothetical protein SETIT_1G148500v2 [Setaria italica]|uniref:ATP-dependent DNA helicase n=1 Tax=Setaria italica TaxID=4555 RepID=A0A368PKS0_SETIT|nr:hypothetical protein SETIT_1G148500v2 [Setaria italica]